MKKSHVRKINYSKIKQLIKDRIQISIFMYSLTSKPIFLLLYAYLLMG